MNSDFLQHLHTQAARIRRNVVELTHKVGAIGTHIGGSLSMVELLAVLYNGILTFNQTEKRDRFILSKGHGAMALYAALYEVGILTDEDLQTFKENGSEFSTHPTMNVEKGIEFSSGSLGQGLSLGAGTALALRLKQNDFSKVFVLMGDGECDEGSVWEAAMSAHHYHLNNLILIVDKNNLQLDGEIREIMDLSSLKNKFESFGWEVSVIADGHNLNEIFAVLNNAKTAQGDSPRVVIAETIKGKGISFMENKYTWHTGVLTDELYEQAIKELKGL